jgi:Putative Actinobacterial Holin-X, holin superfamily III
MTHDPQDPTSTARLIAATLSDLADLMQKEGRLARAELVEKAGAGVRSAVCLGVAAIFAFVAFLVAVAGVVFVVASFGLAMQWSCFIVAAALIILAIVLLLVARARAGLTPERFLAQVRKDVRIAKEQAR